MNNTMQLYIDDDRKIKGYPITSPDRVIDENGKNIKAYLHDNVKFNIVEGGGEVPPFNNDNSGSSGNNDNSNGNINELNEEIANIKNQLTKKADKDGSLQTNLNAQKVGGKTVDELALKDRNLQVGLNAQMIDGKTVDELALKTELDTVKEKVNEINIDKDNIPMLDTTGKIPASNLDKGFDILAKDERDLTLNNLDLKKYSHLEIGLGAWREVLIQINEVTIGSIQGSAKTTKGFIGCLSSNGCFYYHDHEYTGTLHIVSESANILDGPNNTLKIVGRPAHSSDEGWVQEGMADHINIIGVK